MNRPASVTTTIGTIFLDFACVSRAIAYKQIETADSPLLMRYLLDREENQTLSRSLFAAIDRVYPDYPWSSPGDSIIRRLHLWSSRQDRFPEIQQDPEAGTILSQLRELREAMTGAFASREFDQHFYPDVPEAVGMWIEQGYRVITFSACSEQEQLSILSLAVPDRSLVATSLDEGRADTAMLTLLARFPEEPARCSLVSENYLLAGAARRHRVKPVLLDRRWMQEPYWETGHSLNVGKLTDIDPDMEMLSDSA